MPNEQIRYTAPITGYLLAINRQFDVDLIASLITIGHAMSLYGDLHVELEMSILDRSYGGLKRSIECRSFGVPLSISMVGSTIDLVDVVSIWCRYGVDGVDGGGLPIDYYVLDPV